MTDHIDGIIAGMSEAEKRAVLGAKDLMSNHGGYPFMTVEVGHDPWPEGIAQFLTLKADRLTPLGLAVRARLEASNG